MLTCHELGIPQRLWKESYKIEIDNDFTKDLVLYRRFPPDIEIIDNKISSAMFGRVFAPPFNISVNRSYYCKFSTDVLYSVKNSSHMFTHGVIQAIVKNADGYTFMSNGSPVTFRIEHDPMPCMYPHSIIVISKDKERIDKKISSKTLKADIREHLGKLFEKICHFPDATFISPEEILESGEQKTGHLTFFQRYVKPIWQKLLEFFG